MEVDPTPPLWTWGRLEVVLDRRAEGVEEEGRFGLGLGLRSSLSDVNMLMLCCIYVCVDNWKLPLLLYAERDKRNLL